MSEIKFRKKLRPERMTPQELAVRRPFRVEVCRKCGESFETRAKWNRVCPNCGRTNWFVGRSCR